MPPQHTLQIECVQGDIAAQPDVDAVVCAANPNLTSGAGVAGAIHGAAGPGLYREAAPLAPVRTGDAVITGAHGLPNRHVIHTVGPIYGRDEPAAGLLASCHRRCLELADQARLGSVAFPAISTGVYGYPVAEAARVSLATVLDAAPDLRSVRRVRFVLWSVEDLRVFSDVLERLTR
ncbi:MAG TPA: macro domain-containing protein [Longimicrobiales bacterium]|nr:macro domain-containing protein [Longimicrobiales bacterium]